MKQLFSTSLLMVLFASMQATIITVSNYSGSPAMYSTLTSAIDAASVDDTLLIHASGAPYLLDGYAGFNKRLIVIGSGWGTTGVKVRGFTGDCCGNAVNITAGADGSMFQGIEFVSICGISANSLFFKSCRFNPESNDNCIRTATPASCPNYCGGSSFAAQDLVFQNCYFNSMLNALNNDSNLLFENCIFQELTGNYHVGLRGSESQENVLQHTFNHNIFLSDFDVDFSNAVFRNNIFSGIASTGINSGNYCYNCTFENNLTYCASCSLSGIVGAVLINNQENQPQPFVNNSTNFLQADFNLNASSIGNDYATDGSDVGVNGGASPYLPGMNYGSVLLELPIISDFLLQNSVLQQGTNLNFQATSTIPTQE